MRNVTRKHLRALAAVVDTGSVSLAARRLNVTPPAVTMQVQQLEQELGLPLVDRSGDRFRPTEAGREVVDAALRVEKALEDCAAALAAMSGLERGRVSVGLVSTAKYFAPHAVGAFARAHPGIEVRIVVGNREDIIDALQRDGIDLAVMGRPPESLSVEKTVIGDHPHLIIAPMNHPLSARGGLVARDLARETFLVREQGSGTRLLMERFFEQAGVRPLIGMEIGSNETIKQAVMAGLGLALISAHTVAAELQDRRLAALGVAGLPIVRQWFVVRRRDKRRLPPAEAIHSFLVDRGAEYLPKPE